MSNYDVIIIGAGSVGVPAALALSEKKLKVLVIDSKSSVGQENNKKAIGGIRATHSDFGKIKVSQRSIEIFSTWKEKHGDDIGWMANGYSFPAYNIEDEKILPKMMQIPYSSKSFKTYEIKAGDTLESISEQFYGTTEMTDKIRIYNIVEFNRLRVGRFIVIPVSRAGGQQ